MLRFLGMQESKFDYCKVSTKGSEGVVAVIGDSHAHVAFPGISKGLEKYGLTTVLLANSSCPPLLGSPEGKTEDAKRSCSIRINEIISKVQSLEKLDSVIIFTRGTTYWEGNEPANTKQMQPSLDKVQYFHGLQRTTNELKMGSINVYYVTENPELQLQARSCLPRPLNAATGQCDQVR